MFNLSIFDVKKTEVIYKEMTSNVVLPGEDGELTIMDFHEPIISCLREGMIRSDNVPIVKINRGVAKIHGSDLFIMVDR